MATTVGGMRHIGVAAGLPDQVCGEIRNLDEKSLNQVLQLIGKLKQQQRGTKPPADLATADVLKRHVKTWSFNEGERDKLVGEVYKLREGVR